jgi:predicted transcriptional regulator
MAKVRLIDPDVRAETIQGRAKIAGMEISELAKRTGIPRSTLYRLLKQPDDIRVSQIEVIQKRIHMTLDEFLSICRLKRSDFPEEVR